MEAISWPTKIFFEATRYVITDNNNLSETLQLPYGLNI